METDSPYLTPPPIRGKRNEPQQVALVARRLAEARRIPLERIAEVTTQQRRDAVSLANHPRAGRSNRAMRLFNTPQPTASRTASTGDAVTLYVCGITPYDTTHLGHAFINVVYDTLRRYLRWRGQPVRYVQNVTDIDDDILRKAKRASA